MLSLLCLIYVHRINIHKSICNWVINDLPYFLPAFIKKAEEYSNARILWFFDIFFFNKKKQYAIRHSISVFNGSLVMLLSLSATEETR